MDKSLKYYMRKVDTIILLTLFTLSSLTVIVYSMTNPDQALRKGRTPRSSRSSRSSRGRRGRTNDDTFELDDDTLDELREAVLAAKLNQLTPAY